jgi:DNA transposition AAA+ family ATPase
MNTNQKNDIVALINAEIERLGSQENAARKCGVSAATISHMRAGNWASIADSMWTKVASALGYRPEGWQLVDITNTHLLHNTLASSKKSSLFMAVSHRAGSGKTASLKLFEAANRDASVFYLSCREWAKREFLQNLAQSLGLESGNKAQSMDILLMAVTAFFKVRHAQRPLLILDEADKLKGPALRSLITLYNECEDTLGVVIVGTEHLAKQMQADARLSRKGADELLSRFGRRFINLVGATEADVAQICRANGLKENATIKAIFKECEPVNRILGGTNIQVVEDLRRVKRCVQRELLKLAQPMAEAA